MPRKLRVQYPGAMYHVMNRGDQRKDIFQDDKDRRVFASTLGEACRKTEWQVHACCLMSNHFHLVIETPRPNLVAVKGVVEWNLSRATQHRFLDPADAPIQRGDVLQMNLRDQLIGGMLVRSLASLGSMLLSCFNGIGCPVVRA